MVSLDSKPCTVSEDIEKVQSTKALPCVKNENKMRYETGVAKTGVGGRFSAHGMDTSH